MVSNLVAEALSGAVPNWVICARLHASTSAKRRPIWLVRKQNLCWAGGRQDAPTRRGWNRSGSEEARPLRINSASNCQLRRTAALSHCTGRCWSSWACPPPPRRASPALCYAPCAPVPAVHPALRTRGASRTTTTAASRIRASSSALACQVTRSALLGTRIDPYLPRPSVGCGSAAAISNSRRSGPGATRAFARTPAACSSTGPQSPPNCQVPYAIGSPSAGWPPVSPSAFRSPCRLACLIPGQPRARLGEPASHVLVISGAPASPAPEARRAAPQRGRRAGPRARPARIFRTKALAGRPVAAGVIPGH